MPVKRVLLIQEEYPDLVSELRRVLHDNRKEGPEDEPTILIAPVRFSDKQRVTVIWDKWKGIDPEARGHLILEAFEQEFGRPEALRISIAMGVTKEEATRIGISSEIWQSAT